MGIAQRAWSIEKVDRKSAATDNGQLTMDNHIFLLTLNPGDYKGTL